jgi:mannose-6-phosphate isomerase
MNLPPVRLLPSYRPKLWGHTNLEPWFRKPGEKIGEVWFTFDENQTDEGRSLIDLIRTEGADFLGTKVAPGRFPILVKFIFTSEKLSIQVHPDDEHAIAWENSLGKTEMWHVLRAEPSGNIALGLQHPVTRDQLRAAAVSGEIEQMLRWFTVRSGDTFFTPTGTVHAIGAGLALVEIQQNSDITYRLYDYGRPRELHLDKAIAVSDLNPHPGPSAPVAVADGIDLLARCRYFATEKLAIPSRLDYTPDPERCHVLIVLSGNGSMGSKRFETGEAWVIPASAEQFEIRAESPASFLRTYVP